MSLINKLFGYVRKIVTIKPTDPAPVEPEPVEQKMPTPNPEPEAESKCKPTEKTLVYNSIEPEPEPLEPEPQPVETEHEPELEPIEPQPTVHEFRSYMDGLRYVLDKYFPDGFTHDYALLREYAAQEGVVLSGNDKALKRETEALRQ